MSGSRKGRKRAEPGAGWVRFVPAALLVLSVLALCLPMLVQAPLQRGSDVFANMHYLREFMTAFSEGDLYPRWTGGTNRGLGAPSFVLFPPLFFYAAGAAGWIAGSAVGGVKLFLLVLAILTWAAFYLLAREWIGPGPPAGVAASLYLLLPYHVMDMYQRFAMSETMAFLFVPLILLFARRVLEGSGAAGILGLSLSYAALIYTHIVSAYTFSLLLGAWLLWQGWGRWGRLIAPCIGLALGLALAAPALLPAIFERAYANMDWVLQMPNGDFRINFIFRDDTLPGLGIKDPVKPLVLRSAISQLILAGAAGALALAGLARSERRRRGDLVFLMAVAGIAYLLQLEISTPLWRVVPELPTIQFPWRLQFYMVLAGALLAGYALRRARDRGGPRIAGPLLLVVLIASNLWFSWGNATAKPFDFTEEFLARPGAADWVAPSATPVEFTGYRRFRFERAAVPGTSFTGGAGEVEVELREASHRVLRTRSVSGGEVQAGTFWFPGWRGRIDGESLELRPLARSGLISFTVPPGDHRVELEFGATPLRRMAAWIGLLGAAGILVGAWVAGRLRGRPSGAAAG